MQFYRAVQRAKCRNPVGGRGSAVHTEVLERRQLLSAALLTQPAVPAAAASPGAVVAAFANLPAPGVVSPGTASAPGPLLTTRTPTFTWKATTGVTFTGYQLNLFDQTSSKFASYQVGKSVTSFTVPSALAGGDKFVWNLRLLNGTASGPPSTYLYFQAPPATVLPAPVVVGPGSTAAPGPVLTTRVPTFTWKATTGVTFTGYQLNLFDQTLNKFVSYQVGKSVTSFTVPTALAAGDKFVWNLRLLNGSQSGPPSTYLYFQTPPAATLPAPVVIGPGSTSSASPTLTSTTPTFSWKAVTGVAFDTYQINLYDETLKRFVSFQVSNKDTSFTPHGRRARGRRHVRVEPPPARRHHDRTRKRVSLLPHLTVGPGGTL